MPTREINIELLFVVYFSGIIIIESYSSGNIGDKGLEMLGLGVGRHLTQLQNLTVFVC